MVETLGLLKGAKLGGSVNLASEKVPVSAIILTKNEAVFIERCIRSVAWTDEVLVIDSESSDATQEIARSLGARVVVQPWLGWAGQRQKAVVAAQHDWVLFVEADEIVTPELALSIQAALKGSPDPRDGYVVNRRNDFLGLLLFNDTRPSKRRNFVRLFNRRESAYDFSMKVHEEVRFPGTAVPLAGVLLHWRGYTMNELVGVFNRYATVEAEILDEQGVRATPVNLLLRPILRFLWSYIAKGGFRQGTRGLMHAVLKATSDYIRYAKLWERQNVVASPHPPLSLYNPELSDDVQDETQHVSAGAARAD